MVRCILSRSSSGSSVGRAHDFKPLGYGSETRAECQFVLKNMHEPKYRLNKKDDARWRVLLTRHCLECPTKPGQKRKFSKKYPPLSPAENAEFEALCAKRTKKFESHPKVRESIELGRKQDRKIQRLLRKLEKLVTKLKKHEIKL